MAKERARGPLRVEPDANAENAFDQLVAAVARIEQGLGDVVDAVSAGPQTRERIAALALSEPEPLWLREMRDRYQTARSVNAMAVVLPREAVAQLLTLIDLARRDV